MTQAEAPPDLALAIELHRDGRLDEAATHYARALDAAPDDPEALHGVVTEGRRPVRPSASARLGVDGDGARRHGRLG